MPASAQRYVPCLAAEGLRPPQQRHVDGGALRLVRGEGVAVAQVPALEIVAVELEVPAVVKADGHTFLLMPKGGDGAAGAVEQPVGVVVDGDQDLLTDAVAAFATRAAVAGR